MQISPQKRATIVSSSVAILLVVLKLTIGFMSGSVTVLASAIDSFLDSIVSIFNFFAIKTSEEHPNEEYHYGKGKVQAIAAVIEGTVITISGIYILSEAIEKLTDNIPILLLKPALIAMFFSFFMTFFLVRYLLAVAKETDNIVIKADALHYQTDLWSNAVVLVTLLVVWATQWNIIDSVMGFAIGIYIIYSAYQIIVEGVEILLDKSLNADIVTAIGAIIDSQPQVTSHHWLRTRTDGTTNFVEFHLVLRPSMLLLEAHRIADEIEEKIMALESKKRWVITPHFDPYDDEEMNKVTVYGKSLVEK